MLDRIRCGWASCMFCFVCDFVKSLLDLFATTRSSTLSTTTSAFSPSSQNDPPTADVTIASAVVSTTAVDIDPGSVRNVPSDAVNTSESEGMMPHGDVITVSGDVIIVVWVFSFYTCEFCKWLSVLVLSNERRKTLLESTTKVKSEIEKQSHSLLINLVCDLWQFQPEYDFKQVSCVATEILRS